MKRIISLATLILLPGIVAAQSANGTANSGSASDAGAVAATGPITFEGSPYPDSQRVHTTPNVYVAPSMFGSGGNCGVSSTATVGITGFGLGGSVASESDACNARQDTATAWNLGLKDVAILRFACFGEEANRLAYEAAGYQCPEMQQTQAEPDRYAQPEFIEP